MARRRSTLIFWIYGAEPHNRSYIQSKHHFCKKKNTSKNKWKKIIIKVNSNLKHHKNSAGLEEIHQRKLLWKNKPRLAQISSSVWTNTWVATRSSNTRCSFFIQFIESVFTIICCCCCCWPRMEIQTRSWAHIPKNNAVISNERPTQLKKKLSYRSSTREWTFLSI